MVTAMQVLKMNDAMRRLYSPDWDLGCVPLPNRLHTILKAGIVLHEGCYVLKALAKHAHVSTKRRQDRTGYESFVNHVHMCDYGDDRLPIAFTFLHRVSDLLRAQFAGRVFLGTVSGNLQGQECVARFYGLHDGEPPCIADDLEDYKENAVCLIDLS